METNDLKAIISKFPQRPGIYFFKNKVGKIIYIGKALSLKDRLSDYLNHNADVKTKTIVQEAATVAYQELGAEFYALLLEAKLIKQYQPKYNISLKDDKSFIYVFISTSETLPKIWIVHRPQIVTQHVAIYNNIKGIYFGPFPSANILRNLLKNIRRIFPFCQQKNNRRPCFYSQLRLCQPCPGYIVRQEATWQKQLTQQYQQNIKRIIKLFNGQNELLKKELKLEMNKAIKKLYFEQAGLLKNQLRFLENLTTYTQADELIKTAETITTEFQKEADDLQTVLKDFFPTLNKIEKIEAYDISNFQGSFAVGSQIVFVNGLPEKSLYKRYKIRTVQGISDVAMLVEILRRRLKHREWPFPDLILIDGGAAQLHAGLKIQAQLKTNIPMIGLAKRLEQVVVKTKDKFIVIKVSSQALNLLKRVRDEAHRFALSYHRWRFKLLTEGSRIR